MVLKLKTAWRDGTTHLVMSPLEFMQRLAALVPRPRLHLIRFHGVLVPNAKLRALVVPQEVPQVPETSAQKAKPAACAAPGTGPWPGPARGLRPPNRDSSGDPATRAAGSPASEWLRDRWKRPEGKG